MILADIVDAGQQTKAIAGNGYEASFLKVDVSNEEDVDRLFETTIARHGRLDILVNNAGVGLARNVTETAISEWDHLMNVNLKGVFLCSKAAITTMRRTGGGAIVNVASAHPRSPPIALRKAASSS